MCKGSTKAYQLVPQLVKGYLEICHEWKPAKEGPEFFGLRDFYRLVNFLETTDNSFISTVISVVELVTINREWSNAIGCPISDVI